MEDLSAENIAGERSCLMSDPSGIFDGGGLQIDVDEAAKDQGDEVRERP
jgi:hypothetical protein